MIKFGAAIPVGRLHDLPSSITSTEQYELMIKIVRHIENLGFESGWLYDHLTTIKVTTESCFECWTTLSALASETRTLRLGTLVTCNSFRHPPILAKMAATVDNISDGRLEFGIGAGHFKREFDAYGIPFPKISVRARQLEEAVQIVKKMWMEEKATFEGKYYTIKDAVCSPKPIQKPHPPITIGGGEERFILRVVAAHADRCNFAGMAAPTIEDCDRKFRVLDRYCTEIGRRPASIEKSLLRKVIIDDDEEEVEKMVNLYRERLRGTHLYGDTPIHKYLQEEREMNIVGTPEQCLERIKRFGRIGVKYLILHFVDAWKLTPLTLFAKKVMTKINA